MLTSSGFSVVIYADDLNSFKQFKSDISNTHVLHDLPLAEDSLHEWGRASQVTFDAAKGDFMIISRTDGFGDPIKLWGVRFDNKLNMDVAIAECVKEVAWNTRTVLRTARHHTDAKLLLFFKSHILSYIAYRTLAIYHASSTSLAPLDKVLPNFLSKCNISELDALLSFNLAPASTRRDIAILGLIHRAVLGRGPKHFQHFFAQSIQQHAHLGGGSAITLANSSTHEMRSAILSFSAAQCLV